MKSFSLNISSNLIDCHFLQPLDENGMVLKGNQFAEKLDSLMVVVCEHLESCAEDGHLVKVISNFLSINDFNNMLYMLLELPFSCLVSL